MSEEGTQEARLPYEQLGEIHGLGENMGHALACSPEELSEAKRKAAKFYASRREHLVRAEMEKPLDIRDQSILAMPKVCPEELLYEYTGAVLADHAHRMAKGFVLRRARIIQALFKLPDAQQPPPGPHLNEPPEAPTDPAPASDSSQEVPAATVT